MARFKAVETYYDEAGNEVVVICGFGRVRDLDEVKSHFTGRVKIIEITAEELAELWAVHDGEWCSCVMRKNGLITEKKGRIKQ